MQMEMIFITLSDISLCLNNKDLASYMEMYKDIMTGFHSHPPLIGIYTIGYYFKPRQLIPL
jgi:hypothetical protein